MELSISYFVVVCAFTIAAVTLTVSIAKPDKPRLRGLNILGSALAYVVISLFLADA